MNMKKWLGDLYEAPVKKTMPVLSFPSVSLMNITVKELIASPELQAKGMKMIADRVPSAASVSMMDLSVEAEAFGSAVSISDDEVPTVTDAIVTDEDEAKELRVPEVGEGRTGEYVKAIQKACELITDRPVFAGVIGPFSLAGRLMNVSEALVNCYTEPDMVHCTMEKTTEFIIKYINAYKAVGANGVVIAEPLTGLLSPELADEFSSPYVKRICDAVRSDDFLFIYHNCGNSTVDIIDSILSIGADAYHFGNAIDMRVMITKVPEDVIIMGNIDPASQFRNGTPESITAATKSLMGDLCCHKNFFISSGCDIPPASPWENIDAYFKAVDDFYAGK